MVGHGTYSSVDLIGVGRPLAYFLTIIVFFPGVSSPAPGRLLVSSGAAMCYSSVPDPDWVATTSERTANVAARKKSTRHRGAGKAGREWIGGVIRTPFYVQDREPAYRAMGIFWLDASDGCIVGTNLVAPDEVDGQVGAVLAGAMAQPMVGRPRRPDRVRVATAAMADEVRAVLGDGATITVAATPELQMVLDALTESIDAEAAGNGGEVITYLANGDVEADAVAEFFEIAKQLYKLAPWNDVQDQQVIRVDIPALDVEGACLSIIGNLGESLGFLLFPSYDGFLAFLDASLATEFDQVPTEMGSGWLALNYDRGADLPDAVRREIAEHGWPVAAPEAYPLVERFDADLVLAPLDARDLSIAAAIASALVPFISNNRGTFADDDATPVCESFFMAEDLEVRLCYPHEAHDDFDILPTLEQRLASASPAISEDAESDLVERLIQFAMATHGLDWLEHTRFFKEYHEAEQLAVPWSLFDFEVAGKAVAARFLEHESRHLSSDDRLVIAAELRAWLSIWEVTGVEPGHRVMLTDLLTGEQRTVEDSTASKLLQPHDGILARVLDTDGPSFFSGLHPRSLPPQDLPELVRLARGYLRRKRRVPIERMKDGKVGRYLIRKWEKTLLRHDLRRLTPPKLSNTDGDPLLHTTDLFLIDRSGNASQVIARLEAMEGASTEETDGAYPDVVFVRPGKQEGTLIGHAEVGHDSIRLHTNSLRRADALQARVEAACGGLIHHMGREAVEFAEEELQAMLGLDGGQAAERTPELEQRELEYKQRHYADWADTPLPALQGKTAREAVRTPAGRQQVDTLLKTMENQERRHKGQWAYDFSGLRAELGLS
jgi:hypothetical protein